MHGEVGRLVRKWHTIANKEKKSSKEITVAIFSCENIFKLIFNVSPLCLEAPAWDLCDSISLKDELKGKHCSISGCCDKTSRQKQPQGERLYLLTVPVPVRHCAGVPEVGRDCDTAGHITPGHDRE